MSCRQMAAVVVLVGTCIGVVNGQPPPAPPTPPPAKTAVKLSPPPTRDQVAARVNGVPVPEIAIYRRLAHNPSESRKEALDILIEDAIVDQYLQALKITVGPEEVNAKLKQMKEEAAKEEATQGGASWDKLLSSMFLTEEELRVQLTSVLRWDEFTKKHATDKALKDFFDKQRSTFDGSQVQARHILIGGNAESAKTTLLTLRKQIEDAAAAETAQVPAGTNNLEREKARMKAMDRAFAERAAKYSECPSKEMGGDIGWFPRTGLMVEPFARAAFVLQPYQMSDPVNTEFGYHLIMVTDRKPGREVQFENMRSVVRDVYCDRLRDAVLTAMRPRAQVVIEPTAK